MYSRRRYKSRRALVRYGGRRRYRGRGIPRRFRGSLRRRGMWGRFTGTTAAPSRPELKFLAQSTVNEALIVAGGASLIFQSLNDIPQGVSETERVGIKVTIKSIQLSGSLLKLSSVGAGAAATSNRVRMLLVWDKQTNGDIANTNEIIDPVVDGMRDIASYSRFVVLKSWLITLAATAGAGDGAANDFGEVQRAFKFYKRCSIPIRFDGTQGVITELATNNLLFMAYKEDTVPLVNITMRARVRYSDN